MKKILLLSVLLASNVSANEIYSRVYVVQNDTSLEKVFKDVNATSQEIEEIKRMNPQVERQDFLPAGTILNLDLYRGTNTIKSALKKVELKNNRVEKNALTFSPLVSLNNFKTGLNNDSEIETSSRAYGATLSLVIPQTSLMSLNLYSALQNVEFSHIKIKQQTAEDSTPSAGETRFNYEVGVKGTFNRSNYYNNFSFLLARKVDHQYYFSKSKSFFTNDVGRYTELSSFGAWWVGAEFRQSLPFFNLPVEAALSYSLILDGSVTSDESSAVKNLNGSQGVGSLVWKFTDSKSLGLSYERFSYESEFSSDGSRFGLFGNFTI